MTAIPEPDFLTRGEIAMNDKTPPLHDMKVLLPPANIEGDYLSGWVEGQSYLILNYGTDEAFKAATKTCDTIEAQATRIEALEAALRPFAEKSAQAMVGYTENWAERMGKDYPVFGWNGPVFVLGDFLAAQQALEGSGND